MMPKPAGQEAKQLHQEATALRGHSGEEHIHIRILRGSYLQVCD
jgi:hypothetical protein